MSRVMVTGNRLHERIQEAGFASVLDALGATLRARGYAATTVSTYSQAALHFCLWAAQQRLSPVDVTTAHTNEFFQHHLPSCRCRLKGTRVRSSIRAALAHLIEVLAGAVPRPDEGVRQSDTDREVAAFDDYLRETCGLRSNTRTYRRRYVREFLVESFDGAPVDPAKLDPQHVIRFITSRAGRYAAGSAQVVASSLRSYFRFLSLRGLCDEAMTMSVPAVANWKLAGVPSVLTDAQLRSLLAAFDRSTATGRRDYAITRCLADLGLRAGEVASLRLDDIKWRQGTVVIAGGKSRRDDKLPLLPATGRAIAAYLRRGRPETPDSRAVFVRHRPPVGRSATPLVIRNAVLRAAHRADLSEVVTGTRILRHTAATRMLRSGATMKEIADVLRHRCLDTTAIYAKVDLPRLATVALPWAEDPQ